MAFNILNIGYDGTVSSSFVSRTNYVSNGDNNDIFYFLGTNFGQSQWSNPLTGSFVSFTGDQGTGVLTNGANLTDNNTGSGATHNTDSAVVYSAQFNFNNIVVRPSNIQLYTSSAGGAPLTAVSILGSSDNITYEKVSDLSNVSSHSWGPLDNIDNDVFYSHIKINYSVANASTWGALKEVKLYGDLKRTDNKEASRQSLATTINQLPDVDISNSQDGDYLYWAGGTVKHKREKLYETVRTTDNIILSDNQFLPNFYIVTPSSNKTVDLPANPVAGQFFRFKNLDNSFELQIREPGAVVVATIGGATGPGLTQADCYYDGTDWQIITY